MAILKTKITDLRQTSEWANYLTSIGWKVEYINNNYYFLKHLPILGYFLKVQRPREIDLKAINQLSKKYKVYKTVIEPGESKTRHPELAEGKLSKSFYLPTKTIQIDLTKSEKDILKQMSSKTRYNINLAKKKGLKIVRSNDIEKFTKFWRNNFERKRFPFLSQQKNVLALFKAFDKNADLLFAIKENQIISGLLILRTRDCAYYMYAASNNLGRKLFAPTLLTWAAIKLAKNPPSGGGCKIFDFDGIYDERFPLKSWIGFTKFKKGFGGRVVEYPGCFVKTKLGFRI